MYSTVFEVPLCSKQHSKQRFAVRLVCAGCLLILSGVISGSLCRAYFLQMLSQYTEILQNVCQNVGCAVQQQHVGATDTTTRTSEKSVANLLTHSLRFCIIHEVVLLYGGKVNRCTVLCTDGVVLAVRACLRRRRTSRAGVVVSPMKSIDG